eukprot:1158668-Pelagomonas_calceolata.AAC.1
MARATLHGSCSHWEMNVTGCWCRGMKRTAEMEVGPWAAGVEEGGVRREWFKERLSHVSRVCGSVLRRRSVRK